MNRRVPIDVAAKIAGVSQATIRSWVHRKLITRHWDGFDVKDLIDRVDTRDPKMTELRQRRRT